MLKALCSPKHEGIFMAELAAHLDFAPPETAQVPSIPYLRLMGAESNLAEASVASYAQVQETLGWINADAIEELADARTAARQDAEKLLESRMQLLREGAIDQVPYLVDPLTTAARANQAKATYGLNSEQYHAAHQSLVVDSQRLLAEAWRKNSWEYFAPLQQTYDPQSGGYTFKSRQLLDMVADGVTPAAEPEEVDYRLGEYVEEVTYGAVRKLGKLAIGNVVYPNPAAPSKLNTVRPDIQIAINTISECADWAINAYKNGSKTSLGGYAPEKEKVMLRSVRYDSATDSRLQEQIGVPGKFYTRKVRNEAMRRLGAIEPDADPSKPETRATQMISTRGEGALKLLQVLDDVASEFSGLRIFRGEVIADDEPKDYASIPAIAEARQRQLENDSVELADMLETLEANGIDHWAATGVVEHRVKQMLYDKAKLDPSQAAIAFDEATAQGIEEVAQLEASGYIDAARSREQEVFKSAPPPSYCGAGSCGLENVNVQDETGKELARKLKAESGDTILRDTERACKHCKSKSIVYAFNSHKINKYCENCSAFESKVT